MELQLFNTFSIESKDDLHILRSVNNGEIYFITRELGKICDINISTCQKRCRKLEQFGQALKYQINKFDGQHGVRDTQEQWILNGASLQQFLKTEVKKKQVQALFACLNTHLPHVLGESQIKTFSESIDIKEPETESEEEDDEEAEEEPPAEAKSSRKKFNLISRIKNPNRIQQIQYDEEKKVFLVYDILNQFIPFLTKRDARQYMKDHPLIPLPNSTTPMVNLELAVLLCLKMPNVTQQHRIFVAQQLCVIAQSDPNLRCMI